MNAPCPSFVAYTPQPSPSSPSPTLPLPAPAPAPAPSTWNFLNTRTRTSLPVVQSATAIIFDTPSSHINLTALRMTASRELIPPGVDGLVLAVK